MTKQEEIREGIAEIIKLHSGSIIEFPNQVAYVVTQYLHSKGVVIKVDRELPERPLWVFPNSARESYEISQQDMLKAGYTKTEPLIKEE